MPLQPYGSRDFEIGSTAFSFCCGEYVRGLFLCTALKVFEVKIRGLGAKLYVTFLLF